jgi:D-arabinose 1-dehydrogenase-like Zn-dependent alcohol dehydrogenase
MVGARSRVDAQWPADRAVNRLTWDASMRIRAYAIMEPGGAAKPFEYDAVLGPHDVLVRITHRTIARDDVQAIDNDWGDTRYPLVPGHEMVGVVAELAG